MHLARLIPPLLHDDGVDIREVGSQLREPLALHLVDLLNRVGDGVLDDELHAGLVGFYWAATP